MQSLSKLIQNNSSIGYKTFASQFSANTQEGFYNAFEQKTLAIKHDKLKLLHSLDLQNNYDSSSQKNQNQQTLLHYAAYFNSPTCALYLLHKKSNIDALDKQGKSVFHLCAYTGHVKVMTYLHEFWKINKIKNVSVRFLDVLSKIGFKRTDAKLGKLKSQVSKQRTNKFLKGQQQLIRIYKEYRNEYIDFILKSYELSDVSYNRNCFHYTSLNKYQKCLSTLQYMIKSLHNQDLVLSDDLLMSLTQIGNQLNESLDPRQYQDCLSKLKEFIHPQVLKDMAKQQNTRINNFIVKILESNDKDGHSPIFLASKTGSATILSLLKRFQEKCSKNKMQNANIQDSIIKIALNNSTRNQITDLCQTSKNSDVGRINFLISCGQQINKKKSIFGTFALLQAVKAFQKQRNLEPIKILLKSGADVNQQDSNGWTIFHHISQKGYVQILKELFKQRNQNLISKLNINRTTNKRYHPLHIAAINDRVEIIDLMMNTQISKRYQIDTNPLDQQKQTILHYSAKKGSLKTLQKILELKGKSLVTAKDINDNTCLHLAAMNSKLFIQTIFLDHMQCIKRIIKYDSDNDNLIKIKNKKGKLPIDLTLKKKYFDNIFTASRQGDVNAIRNLINQKIQVKNSVTEIKRRTPLILSVLELQLVNVKFLMDSNADKHIKDIDGKTATNYADELEQLYIKKDKTKLPLIKKIKSLLD